MPYQCSGYPSDRGPGGRRLETAYDTYGNPHLFTSYDAASSGNVVNQVQRDFNGLGQMTKEYQEHRGAVNTGTSLKVQYAYSEMASGANHSRLTKITYPNGKELDYNYSTGLNDNISRLSSLSDSTGTLESYDFLGLGTSCEGRIHNRASISLGSNNPANRTATPAISAVGRDQRLAGHSRPRATVPFR